MVGPSIAPNAPPMPKKIVEGIFRLHILKFRYVPKYELNTIWIIDIPIASLISIPDQINIGINIVPPPIPKNPDSTPTKIPDIM
jgi:hypothetical protein